MFEKMRRSDRLLDEVEVNQILAKAQYGVLSTIGENGYPYGVPVNYVYLNGKVLFHCARNAGAKQKNIAFSDKVCFTVIGDDVILPDKFSTLYESVVIFGLASKVTDSELKQDALEAIIEKFSPEFRDSGLVYIKKMGDKADIFEIVPTQVTGKANR